MNRLAKMWFKFAGKRILGAEYGYDYGVINGRCVFQCNFATVVVICTLVYGCFQEYMSQIIIPNKELLTVEWHLLISVAIISLVLASIQLKVVDMLGYALQESVYVVELPSHLKNRNIYSYYPHKKDGQNSKDDYSNNIEQNKDSFWGEIFGFFFKMVKVKFFKNTFQGNCSLSPVGQMRNRKDIRDNEVQVGQGYPQQDSGNTVFYTGSADKKKGCEQKVENYTAYGNNEHLGDAGCGKLWLCRSCAFSTVGENTEFDGNPSYFPRKDNTFTSEPYPFKRYPQHEKCGCVPEFVYNNGWIVADKETAEKCKYIYHLINQAPFKRLTRKAKAYIVLTSPVWLFHLLFDGKNIKIISPEKYKEWKLEHSDVFSLMDTNGPDMAVTDGMVSGICMGLLSSAVVMALLSIVHLSLNGPR